ncbi:MAG: hypothetical protein ACI9T8_000365, partial [Candidatus Saccharimonadales bacterium]
MVAGTRFERTLDAILAIDPSKTSAKFCTNHEFDRIL